MSDNGKTASTATKAHAVIGTRPIRYDGTDKVTGKALYGVDVNLPGMLHGAVLRSPLAHARIRSIDTSQAEALSGVMAVVTAKDIWETVNAVETGTKAEYTTEESENLGESVEEVAEVSLSVKFFRDHYLASDKVFYCGHPVALVAATDQYIAEEALSLIKVDYEELPPVLDVFDAMKDTGPLLHDRLITHSLGKSTGKPSNVAQHFRQVMGDPEKGFAEADVIIEREFRTTQVHQGYLEAHAGTASMSPDGNLTVWSSHQGQFVVRDSVAELLKHPIAQVHVIPMEVGGGFGGKLPNYVQPQAALLARKSGRPVKLVMSRADTFEGTGPASGCYMKVKMGTTRAGRITAATAELIFEAGAFPGSSVGGAARCMFGPYDIQNGQIDGYDVVLNKPKSAAYRGPGAPQGAFAAESVMNELAEIIGMDPLEFRLKNIGKEGDRNIAGITHRRVGFAETLKAAMTNPHYTAPLGGPNRGRGVGCGWWPNFGGISACSLNVNGDGTVNLALGSIDLSGTRTAVAMQVAETLCIEASQVQPTTANTDSIGYTGQSGGSRTTYSSGIVAIEAARDALAQMTKRAASMWQVDAETVQYESGIFTTNADLGKQLTFKEVAAKLPVTGGPIFVTKSIEPSQNGSTLGVHIADVEVDPETGKVQVLRYTVVQDVGKAIHPSLVEGQIQGGVAQGIGWALWEGYQFDEKGRVLTKTFLDYKMPTAYDLPMIDIQLLEIENPGHPYGVRGVGETPVIPPLGAMANAVYKATGVRMFTLPMTAARILEKTGVIS